MISLFIFNEEVFFIYILPPIIFNAGFRVKKKQFFDNFVAIWLFGALGTIISFVVIAFGIKFVLEAMGVDFGDSKLRVYLAIGAIFLATDSVSTLQVLNQEEMPLLYSIVFGEGVVNDATAVVLFKAIQRLDHKSIDLAIVSRFIENFFFLFICSTVLGVVIGLLCAVLIKKLYSKRHSTNREVALMIVMAYLSYMMAELFQLSRILTVFFCGIAMSHYTWYNVTEHSRITTKHAFATMSFIAETFIFLYVGMDALDVEKLKLVKEGPGKHIAICTALLCLVAIGRAISVFLLSLLSNFTKRNAVDRLDYRQQVTIWWAGLMRGAVSMALAYHQFAIFGKTEVSKNATMIICTIIIVLFSTVVFGLLTKQLLRRILPASSYLNVSEHSTLTSMSLPLLTSVMELENGDTNIPRSQSFMMLLTDPTNTIHYHWKKFDQGFMKPKFGGKGSMYTESSEDSLSQKEEDFG